MNQGNAPGIAGIIINVTLIGANPTALDIPVVSTSFAAGAALAAARLDRDASRCPSENHPQKNVIAELPGRTTTTS